MAAGAMVVVVPGRISGSLSMSLGINGISCLVGCDQLAPSALWGVEETTRVVGAGRRA